MALQPPPRKIPPPVPTKRSSALITRPNDNADDVEQSSEQDKPLGIAARIASLRLNQIGLTPGQKQQSREPEPEPQRIESPEIVEEDVVEEPVGAIARAYCPDWEEIEARGPDFVRLVSREPPPIPGQEPPPPIPSRNGTKPPPLPGRRLPPMPARLPTPPPEPEPEPELEYLDEVEEQQTDSCLKCHDFSFVDDHAAQFPRHTVTSLDQLAYDLTSPWQSETEKFRAIFSWLHFNVSYDVQSFFSGNIQAATPESTFHSGLAVCDGYAGLFLSLSEKAGLQAMKVTGHGKGFGYAAPDENSPAPQFEMNHAWNCALMDGDWRLIDSCWGSGHIDSSQYHPKFNSSWFTSTNAEFGKRHFPEDPGYQLVSDDEGGAVSWETYILEPEGPLLYGHFYDHNLAPGYLQPDGKFVHGGSTVSFHLFKLCEHMSTAEADNYVYIVKTPDEKMTTMTLNAEGGWSASAFIPRNPGAEVTILYVKEVSGEDAKGLGVGGWNAVKGKKAMMFGAICRWNVA